jgi:hypothetical protein
LNLKKQRRKRLQKKKKAGMIWGYLINILVKYLGD